MSKTLWSNVNHQIHVAYQKGYGKSASERRGMREDGERTIAVKSSRSVIAKDCKRFCEYVKENHPEARTIEKSREYIGEWTDKLLGEGIKHETVHGYIDHLGVVYGVSGGKYGLGRSAEPTKGRDISVRDQADRLNPKYENFLELARMTGLRRSELEKISYNDFFRGNDGQYYVGVYGKGGRYQEQRINPDYADRAAQYIERKSDERIINSTESRNHINIHGIRRGLSQEMYERYREQASTKSGREELYEQVKEAFKRGYNRSPESNRDWHHNKDITMLEKDINSVYKTRGAQRQTLEKLEKATEYDRLALLAVSVFHLAHWRCDVTVHNYCK